MTGPPPWIVLGKGSDESIQQCMGFDDGRPAPHIDAPTVEDGGPQRLDQQRLELRRVRHGGGQAWIDMNGIAAGAICESHVDIDITEPHFAGQPATLSTPSPCPVPPRTFLRRPHELRRAGQPLHVGLEFKHPRFCHRPGRTVGASAKRGVCVCTCKATMMSHRSPSRINQSRLPTWGWPLKMPWRLSPSPWPRRAPRRCRVPSPWLAPACCGGSGRVHTDAARLS